MAASLPSSAPALPGAVVVDANVCVSIAARESTQPQAQAAITHYLNQGYEFYAPGVLITETLYVLCGKRADGSLLPDEHNLAIEDFAALMGMFLPPPVWDGLLIERAEAIRGSYTCRRSADGMYIALAETLTVTGRPTVLLTFDVDMYKQAAVHASGVTVELLT